MSESHDSVSLRSSLMLSLQMAHVAGDGGSQHSVTRVERRRSVFI